MTGKVFNDSNNIYQDQAKILFDYYKAAAQKIVSEEMTAEQNRLDLAGLMEQEGEKQNSLKTKYIAGFAVGGVAAIAGIFIHPLWILTIAGVGFGIKSLLDYQKSGKQILEYETKIREIEEAYGYIRRDYAVEKIGVAYVPVATRVPFEDKSFLIDHTNAVGDTNFQLTVLHQPDEFLESVNSLQDSLDKIPIVETNETPEEINTSEYSVSVQNITLHDYVGNIDRQVRNISYLLNDSENVSVNIPVVLPESEQAGRISEYATNNPLNKPVVQAFPVNFEDKLSKFTSLNTFKDQIKSDDGGDSTDYMKGLMLQLAESVQMFSKTKNAGASKLIDYTSSIFANVLKAGYTQYSPMLEAEEIERVRNTEFDYQTSVNDYKPFTMKKSSVVKYDMFSGNWVAEDGSRTSMPFGMHQVDEEVLMPVISALMEEKRIERLKIYSNIEDQKRDYLDRWSSEIGNYYRDNRKTADELISHMRETYADYMSAFNMYKSLQDTAGMMKESKNIEDAEVHEIDSEAEMLAGFEEQARQCNAQQEQFSEFMDRVQENISDTTHEFAHIEYYEGSLRDTVSHETAVAHSNIHNLDARRKSLVGVSPYLANFGELPPEPKTSPEMFEHVQIDLEGQVAEKISEIYQQQNR